MVKRATIALAAAMLGCPATPYTPVPTITQPQLRGVVLADLTWQQAEQALRPETVVVFALGAASKEHGPHLRLDNDRTLAAYFEARLLAAADVVVAPMLTYHHYPAFVQYPGSITLRPEVARDLVVDACRSLARFGPRRFYVANTGISTLGPLREAADVLAGEGVLLHFTDLARALGEVEAAVAEQPRGSHADEIETSMILYIAPDRVDMTKAVRELPVKQGRGFDREPGGAGTLSRSGVWGDATLARVDKGRVVVEALVAAMLDDLERLRASTPPS